MRFDTFTFTLGRNKEVILQKHVHHIKNFIHEKRIAELSIVINFRLNSNHSLIRINQNIRDAGIILKTLSQYKLHTICGLTLTE